MTTINRMIGESCRSFSSKTALCHKTHRGWEEISYGRLWERSGHIAGLLVKNGFKPGDHAVLLAPSSPEWVCSYIGVLRAGGVVVPVDKELKQEELRHILLDCEARAILTQGYWLEMVQEIESGLPRLAMVL